MKSVTNTEQKYIGKRYNKLLVKSLARRWKNKYFYLCDCDCGNNIVLRTDYLKRGHCGCETCKINDISGQKFYKVNVISLVGKNHSGNAVFKCLCDCGKIFEGVGTRISSGETKSCGCGKIFIGENNSRWKGYSFISGTKWGVIKKSAMTRNIKFDITIEDAWDIYVKQDGKCALTDIPITIKGAGVHNNNTASLDRIDSTKGYTIDNVQWVHKDINTMKWTFSQEKFIELCGKVYLKNQKKETN